MVVLGGAADEGVWASFDKLGAHWQALRGLYAERVIFAASPSVVSDKRAA